MKEMTLPELAELEFWWNNNQEERWTSEAAVALACTVKPRLPALLTLARRALGQPELWRKVDALAERVLAEPKNVAALEQSAPTGWIAAHALPSWMTGLFWLKFEDGTVASHPATRGNGAWWYLGDIKRREHAPVIAYSPCAPPEGRKL